MHVIIIEGIDQIGKTTLINNIAAEIRLKGKEVLLDLHQSTWVPDIPLNKKPNCYDLTNAFTMTYFIEVMNMLKHRTDTVLIVDRLHVSSFAYGWVKRLDNILSIYGTIEHFRTQLHGFEKALAAAVGEDRLHYIQFITPTPLIKYDSETNKDDLKEINFKMYDFFNVSKIKSKHIYHLTKLKTGFTDINTYRKEIANLTL